MDTANDLTHYGVKGMRWGVRKDLSPTPASVTERPGRSLKTTGGVNQPATQDAINAAKLRQKAKKSTTDSLSNEELKRLVARMNLEQQYSNLTKQRQPFYVSMVRDLVKQEGSKQVRQLAIEAVKKKDK